jgi:hypothetical protein
MVDTPSTHAQPDSAAPATQPPALPATPGNAEKGAAPPAAPATPATPATPTTTTDGKFPPGQWAYTSQYGWTWMPYAPEFVYQPPGLTVPMMYVYTTATGWAWLSAPWVTGLGPRPFFSVYMPAWPFTWHWHYAPVWHAHWAPFLHHHR